MVHSTRKTRLYARSVLNAAQKANNLDGVYKRLQTIDKLYKSVPEFRLLLMSKRVDLSLKIQIITNVLEKIATPFEIDLIRILFESKEINLFSQVLQQFFALVEKESDSVKVLISTAVTIDEESISEIIKSVGKFTRKSVEHFAQTDPGLIGGMTLRIGNTIVDGSVSNRLEKLKMSLLRA